MIHILLATLLGGTLLLTSCAPDPSGDASHAEGQSLVLALAVLGENEDGSPKLLPGRLGILTRDGEGWSHRTLEDPDNNVFHKAMAYESEGLLSLSGNKAAVKLWRPVGDREKLWEADFGGQFSRMRDAEVGDIYGDGNAAIAVATHDQGVVAILRRDDSGNFTVVELDRQPNTVVHEIELGDLDGDGVMEVYATPTAPNKVDGTPQPGSVVRYVPARNEGRTEVADLGDRHAKEILVADVDGDGRDELYVSVEAISGGKVEIRRYQADTDPAKGELVASLDDKLCRFLTVGDIDGDGVKEMIAATNKRGLWLLRPGEGRWDKEQIDDGSSGFEHASILLDLDADGRDELYVASDNQKEVRRYDWTTRGWKHEVLLKYEDKLSRFTWNIMAVPSALIPTASIEITDTERVEAPEETAAVEEAAEITGEAAAVEETSATTEEAVVVEESTETQEIVRGLRLNSDQVSPGHVLYAPLLSGTTYLIDNEGAVVHTWESDYGPSGSAYLLDNGHLLRGAREPDVPVFKGGGQGGRMQEFSWDGELLWDWKFANEEHLLHHDIEPLPNGNILAISWEGKSAKEVVQAGRRPDLTPQAGLWPDMIVEIEPQRPNGGRIVWEWHMWDHLVQDFNAEKSNYGTPFEHPERIDINGDRKPLEVDPEELARLKALGYVPADTQPKDLSSDLLHSNGVHYNPELDQIAISVHNFHEVWIVDHSTSTEQAAGSSGGRWKKGGDLLYRWGNPQIYRRGKDEQQTLFGQHDIRWIEKGLPGAGHLLVFNNNANGPEGAHSAIYEWAPPTNADGSYVVPSQGAFGPAEPDWKYEAPDKRSFHSGFISGARRQPNGNTLICSGADGRIFEVTKEGEIVWEYWDPYSGEVRLPDGSRPQPVGEATHAVFRATRISPEHPAVVGRDLRPIDPQPQTGAASLVEEPAKTQEVVRGLRHRSDEAAPGYAYYARGRMTYLIDREGVVVHTWTGNETASSVYLLGNGNLLRCAQQPNAAVFKGGGQGGRLQELSWDGELLWDWKFANEDHLLHHDIAPLPNGNILAISWESKSAKEANQAGRRPDLTPEAGIWPDMIIEVEPQRPNGGRIVWDHLIQDYDAEKSNYGMPFEHPERVDINGAAKPPDVDPEELARLKALGYVPADAQPKDLRSDFLHTNAIDYNADLNQIAISVHNFHEIWIIDHSTTTEEAASRSGGRWQKGGDILYRWGNPRIYGRGTEEQQMLFGQHDIRWIEKGFPGAGHLTVFNNNVKGPDGAYSAVCELVPPTRADGSYLVPSQGSFGPTQPVWKYEAPDKKSFHSNFISGAQRQPNGNTLICSGANGRFFEVTQEGKIVWEFWEPYAGQVPPPDGSVPKSDPKPNHSVFRVTKISPEHPALAGRDLKPVDPQPQPVSDKSPE